MTTLQVLAEEAPQYLPLAMREDDERMDEDRMSEDEEREFLGWHRMIDDLFSVVDDSDF